MSMPAALEVRYFAAVIPAGTPLAVPVTVDVSFPPRTVTQVTWRVPPGPSGLMGWRLSMGGVQVLPTNAGAWVVTDDERDTWPVTGLPDSGAWQVTGYNTDIYDHTVYLTFLLDLPGAVPSPADASVTDPVTAALLNLAADSPATPITSSAAPPPPPGPAPSPPLAGGPLAGTPTRAPAGAAGG